MASNTKTLQKDLHKNQGLRVGEIVEHKKTHIGHEILSIQDEKDATFITVWVNKEKTSTYGSEAFFSTYQRYPSEPEIYDAIIIRMHDILVDEEKSIGSIIDEVLDIDIGSRIDERRLKAPPGATSREKANIVFNVLLRDNGDESDDYLVEEALELIGSN